MASGIGSCFLRPRRHGGRGSPSRAKHLICQWAVTRLVSRLPLTSGQRGTRGLPNSPCADEQESCVGAPRPVLAGRSPGHGVGGLRPSPQGYVLARGVTGEPGRRKHRMPRRPLGGEGTCSRPDAGAGVCTRAAGEAMSGPCPCPPPAGLPLGSVAGGWGWGAGCQQTRNPAAPR